MSLLKVSSNQINFSFDELIVDSIRLGSLVSEFSTSESGGVFNQIVATNMGPSTTIYSGTNSITLIGGFGGRKILTTGSGDDTISSKNIVSGQSNFDQLTGGAGDDLYILRSIFANIFEKANEGIDTVSVGIKSGQTFILPTNVENVLLRGFLNGNVTASGLDNEITGNDGDNVIRALDGNDTVFGRAGADTIFGGNGDDFLNGGMDNDMLIGGNGTDTLIGALGHDSLFGGSGNDFLMGEDGNDSLEGSSGDDILEGGAGNDILSGTDAFRTIDQDILTGGAGVDTFVLGNALGTFYERSGFATITDFEAGERIRVSGSVGNYTIKAVSANLYDITTATSASATDLIAQVTTVGGAVVTSADLISA